MLFVKAVNYCIIKSNSMKNIIPLFAFLFILAACGNEPSSNTSIESPAQEEVTASPKKYTLTPFNASPAFEDATIQSMTYSAGAFNFEITGESYKLGEQTPDAPQKMCANSAEGQHIHLIVDNDPNIFLLVVLAHLSSSNELITLGSGGGGGRSSLLLNNLTLLKKTTESSRVGLLRKLGHPSTLLLSGLSGVLKLEDVPAVDILVHVNLNTEDLVVTHAHQVPGGVIGLAVVRL